jgi:hypothetical protein
MTIFANPISTIEPTYSRTMRGRETSSSTRAREGGRLEMDEERRAGLLCRSRYPAVEKIKRDVTVTNQATAMRTLIIFY